MRGINQVTTASAFALLTLSLAPSASAQERAPWSLPAGPASQSAPDVAGPVDPEDPTTLPGGVQPLPPLPIPTQSPAPAPSPSPTPTPAADPSATPTPDARPTARQAPSPTPSERARPEPSRPAQESAPTPAMPRATPTPTPEDAEARETASPVAPSPAPEPASATPARPEDTTEAWPLWWWALPAGLLALLLLGGFALARRKSEGRKVAPQPAPRPTPRPTPRPAAAPTPSPDVAPPAPTPAPTPTPVPAPPPASNRPQAHGEIAFEAVSLRLSLVYASLRFRLSLRALTEIPPANLHADLTSAHGSASREEQLAPALESLPVIASLPGLREGEDIVREGELQLPLSAIRAVNEGSARFFVPLVRLALVADMAHPEASAAQPELGLGLVFTVGQPGRAGADSPTSALAPIRIDTGPRDMAVLDVREIAAGRRKHLLPLDFAGAPG
ncbi:hypothetical protein [Novosphingobium mangrovi (ex Hu et al. 2023)]|uniref:Uncharacterized protein n=1 Tax=Novosphingobium mangrovi (ex Hu et al. 2023) TaxID=2930094 RepID=A0ABT0AGQ8_9SPHN|nr:hypothetical protein [Novosphingobium mangrovi (ex Hu et al. 2023)]MCJ1962392.1 hypothetical protein [Novosphingobium mangrovi (ex Hu et al. 2023)]